MTNRTIGQQVAPVSMSLWRRSLSARQGGSAQVTKVDSDEQRARNCSGLFYALIPMNVSLMTSTVVRVPGGSVYQRETANANVGLTT